MSPTTVLYIAGTGRSGSTLLARLLGGVDGVFTGGEMRFIWQRGLRERRLCGCGVPVPECPVWGDVLRRSAPDQVTVDNVLGLLAETGRIRHLPALARGQLRSLVQRSAARQDAVAALGALYEQASLVSGARLVVDSSKLPSYGRLLVSIPEIDLRVVHMVRDPRAAAYSWLSRKPLADGATRSHMEQMSPAKSALLWSVWNASARTLLDQGPDRFITVRYEDFVTDPQVTVRRILDLVGMPGADLSFLGGDAIALGVHHTVAGNPDRLRTGAIRLRADERWRRGLGARGRVVVTTVTAPLLRRYGYPLRAMAGSAAPAAEEETIFDRAPTAEGRLGRRMRRLRRHLRWLRSEGVGRMVEEDGLNPVRRVGAALRKWRWRRSHGVEPGAAAPVFLVGLQRSGTNMITRGLDAAPDVEVRNENDSEAFVNFRLRSDDTVLDIVRRSRHSHVLFKPLCESHRVDELLALPTMTPARAIWVYRDVDARSRSAVAKFGRNNLLVLRDIADGSRPDMWQAQGLSAATIETLRTFDYDVMTPTTAAALFWWVRNGLFFELGLERRSDVLLVCYERVVASPVESLQRICTFLGLEYRDSYSAHIDARAATPQQLDIDPRVRRLCTTLAARLDSALSEHAGGVQGLTA